MSVDVKALIAEALDRAEQNRFVGLQPNVSLANLLTRLVSALEAVQQTPAVDRVKMQALVRGALLGRMNAHDASVAVVDAAIATGVLLDAAEVEARGLEKAAQQFFDRLPDGTGNGRAYKGHQVGEILRARAQQVREGN